MICLQAVTLSAFAFKVLRAVYLLLVYLTYLT